MPDWVKQNIPVVVLFILGTYVGLQSLETKFDYQEGRAKERYHILVDIQNAVTDHTIRLSALRQEYQGLQSRLLSVEAYIPHSLTNIEKDVIAIKKDIALLHYKLQKGS